MDESRDKQTPTFTSDDYLDPLSRVEKLTAQEIKSWLRSAFWLFDPFPVNVPSTSRLVIEIANLLKRGSPSLKTRVRVVVPQLLQEWGCDDQSDTLSDLLYLCGRLRCAEAEPLILQIANERLAGRAEEVSLKQRCLAVLSGFGCTERSLHIFKQHISDIEYAAICYRALYRYDLSYAATELSDVYRTFLAGNAVDEFNIVLHTLFRDIPHPKLRMSVLTKFLESAEPQSFEQILQLAKELRVFDTEFFLNARRAQRVEFFKLLLHRSPVDKINQILWLFRTVGVELHIESPDDKEYIECFYEHPETNKGEPERLFPADGLSDERVMAIIEFGERAARVWIATIPEGPGLN